MTAILTLRQIAKQYPGVIALREVDFSIAPGEVRALLGKNGAGKSTLIKILSGAVQPDSGEIAVAGRPVRFHSPHDAQVQGIATVYQELSLVPGLTVAENILLGRWPRKRMLGASMIDRGAIRRIAQAALEQLAVQIDLDEQAGNLSVAQQQLVEIAKAISFEPQVLVLDEPTSALAAGEVEALHHVVRRLAARGHGIIYVTHRLHEIPRVADSVTVLRDGRHVATVPVAEATPARIANMMIGTDWQRTAWERRTTGGEVLLSVRNLRRGNLLRDISFDLRAGEVVGIAGLLGSGRSELVRAIFGRDSIDGGEVRVRGQLVQRLSPAAMKARRVGLTPEDRKGQGLILPFAVQDNLTLACMDRISLRGVLQPQRGRALASAMVDALGIKVASLDVAAGTLSGGNQQKVVIGNWLNTLPDVLLLDEPTRGVDIHAKEQIFRLVRELAERGLAVLFISSEIEEVLDVADRILIMSHGRITGEVRHDEATLEQLLARVMEETTQ